MSITNHDLKYFRATILGSKMIYWSKKKVDYNNFTTILNVCVKGVADQCTSLHYYWHNLSFFYIFLSLIYNS